MLINVCYKVTFCIILLSRFVHLNMCFIDMRQCRKLRTNRKKAQGKFGLQMSSLKQCLTRSG